MGALDLIENIYAKAHRMKRDFRNSMIVSMLIALCGSIVVLFASGFGLASAYMWLATMVAPHVAALYVALALLVIGGGIVIFAKRYFTSPARETASLRQDAAAQTEQAATQVIDEVVTQARQNPGTALLTATALGVVAGLMRR